MFAGRNIEKFTGLSNVQKKIDDFSQKPFLKSNNEKNKHEQKISLNPKKESPGTSAWKGLQSKVMTKNPIFDILN